MFSWMLTFTHDDQKSLEMIIERKDFSYWKRIEIKRICE